MRKTTLVVVSLWLIGAAVTALAQVDTATVVGTIKDVSGAVIPDATATATEADTGAKISVKSGNSGDAIVGEADNQPEVTSVFIAPDQVCCGLPWRARTGRR